MNMSAKNQKSTVKSDSRSGKNAVRLFAKILIGTMLVFVAAGVLACGGALAYLYGAPADLDPAKLTAQQANLRLLDADLQAVAGTQSGTLQPDEVPQNLKDAFISIEDKRFYDHHGIDYRRIAGAAARNLTKGTRQGASTITQQLIKNTHLSAEQTLSRKLKEAQLAIRLERAYSKDEILCMYLNILYFGSGEYGVQNAARRFFDKSVDQLSDAECAMLAGIVKSPTKYNPLHHPDNSNARKCVVLRCMYEQKRLTQSEYEQALAYECKIADARRGDGARRYIDQAIGQAATVLGIDADTLAYGGYTVVTYLDPARQTAMHDTIGDDAYFKANSDGMRPDAIGILVDNATCGVLAYDSTRSADVFSLRRQPGSLIKPIGVYAPALDIGYISPQTMLLDEKTDFDGYAPSNYQDRYYGWMSARSALAHSQNVPAVSTLRGIGAQTARAYLDKMQIALDDEDRYLSLALGGMRYGMTATELVGAYATLANYGVYRPVSFIRSIRNADGQIVYEHASCASVRVYSDAAAYMTTDMLRDCVSEGTASKLRTLQLDVASKTGTNGSDKNRNQDAYNVAYTPQVTTMFWQGNLDGGATLDGSVTGGGAPTLQSRRILEDYYASHAATNFEMPSGVRSLQLDRFAYEHDRVEMLADPYAPQSATISGLYGADNLPSESDMSFSMIHAPEYRICDDPSGLYLEFTPNPRLRYRVYERTLSGENLLSDLCQSDPIRVPISPSVGLFGNSYAIVPYYTDDGGQEVIGLPATYRQRGVLW